MKIIYRRQDGRLIPFEAIELTRNGKCEYVLQVEDGTLAFEPLDKSLHFVAFEETDDERKPQNR